MADGSMNRKIVIAASVLFAIVLLWALVMTSIAIRNLENIAYEEPPTSPPPTPPKPWQHYDRELAWMHTPGKCTQISGGQGGSEDLTVMEDGKVFISKGVYPVTQGALRFFDFNDTSAGARDLVINGGFDWTDIHPHGLSVYKDPTTGAITLMVVTHHAMHDQVEVFQFNEDTKTLTHTKTIQDPMFSFMNDIVAIDSERFYITYFYKYARVDPVMFYRETQTMAKYGQILYYNGTHAESVATGFYMPNGINMSPDKKFVYMAEFGMGKLRTFTRDPTDNSLEPWETVDLPAGVDNVEIQPGSNGSGILWIGGHLIIPAIQRFDDVYGLEGTYSPSVFLKLTTTDGKVTSVTDVMVDDGRIISGGTVVSYYDGKMIAGSTARELILCDANCV